MANPLPDLQAATTATLNQLLADLKTAGATDTAAMETFAQQYAPTVAQIGVSLATATLAGNAADVQRYKGDLADLGALAVATAADLAILNETTSESDLAAFVNGALLSAAKAGLASLIVL